MSPAPTPPADPSVSRVTEHEGSRWFWPSGGTAWIRIGTGSGSGQGPVVPIEAAARPVDVFPAGVPAPAESTRRRGRR